VFIPLHDTNPLKRIHYQYVTVALIVLNVAIYVIFISGWIYAPDEAEAASFAVIPAKLMTTGMGAETMLATGAYMPERFTLVTYMFIHGNWIHLLGNMLFLWVFGDNVEDAMGHVKFLIFYLLCAIAGALFHGLLAPASQVPLVGASGAIAGVVAAYLILHPRVKIWILAFGRIPLRIPAYITLALWILFQFVMFAVGGEDQVSWACHIGGIVAGAVLVLILRDRDVPLFDREVVTPRAVVVEQRSAVRPVEAKPVPRWGRQ
jgi:membrane associated rhomboid family serine protease